MSWRAKLTSPSVLTAFTAVVAVLAFVPAIGGGWIYDDHPLIVHNQYVHSLAHWPRWFVEDFWNLNEEFVRFDPRLIYWRPAISASYAMDWQLSGGSAVWFHVMNLVWHGLVGALSFVVMRRWLGGAALAAFAAAVVFAVHPTKAESVAWISGRTDILCLVAMLVASQGIARRLAGKRGGLALEVLGTLAAYTCKEQAIVLPAFAAVETWVARGRPAIDGRTVLSLVRAAAPQLIVAIAYLALRRAFMPVESSLIQGHPALADHGLIVAESLGRYLALTFAPYELSVQQGLLRVEGGELVHSLPHVVLGIAGVVTLGAVAVLLRRKAPLVTIGIAFYLATLCPTANIVFTQMSTLISERFLYVPMFGLALVAGWALDRYRHRWRWAVVIVLVVAASGQSMDRSLDYRDEKTFWARELELHPNSRQARAKLVGYAIDEKRYADALVQILQLTDATSGGRLEIAFQLAKVVAGIVPDLDRASLEAVDTFCRELIERASPSVTLAVRELRYTVVTQSKAYAAELARLEARLRALRSDLASRLGDDTRAVALAREVLAACPRCPGLGTMAALSLARAAQYEDGLAVLDHIGDPAVQSIRTMIERAVDARDRALVSDGPAQLQARASELSALELWGRAYEVLAPHKEQIKSAPRMVVGFAELAVRAGDPATAREVLAGHMTAAEIEQNVAAWSKKMGW